MSPTFHISSSYNNGIDPQKTLPNSAIIVTTRAVRSALQSDLNSPTFRILWYTYRADDLPDLNQSLFPHEKPDD
jgi:hypothetical protein